MEIADTQSRLSAFRLGRSKLRYLQESRISDQKNPRFAIAIDRQEAAG
jgi:hypothetical protein